MWEDDEQQRVHSDELTLQIFTVRLYRASGRVQRVYMHLGWLSNVRPVRGCAISCLTTTAKEVEEATERRPERH